MVSKSTKKRQAVISFNKLILILLFVLSFTIVILVGLIITRLNSGSGNDIGPDSSIVDGGDSGDSDENGNGSGAEHGGGDHGGGAGNSGSSEASRLPTKANIQPTIDEWVNGTSGDKSVMVYDLERNEIAAHYDSMRNFNTASLYKLFVVYEGYRRLETGEWNADDTAGSTGHTILECLDLAIRESYSPCAETLWAMIGHSELDSIISNDFKIVNSYISGLFSNANDITEMMKLFYHHPDFNTSTLVERMKDSFLNQPVTTYDWRRGLPAGFSSATKVYNKVGWDWDADGGFWNLFHDAAIIETASGRHFIVVEMTHAVPLVKIKQLGSMLENVLP